MKLRIKYEKTGVLRFIGHLDVMRYFQKAIRRAKLDVAYSKGFSPHQIISFAAPMPLGMTSGGEYFDGEFVSVTTAEDMKHKLNAKMADGIRVLDITMLPENAKNSMSVVTASDYFVYTNEECESDNMEALISRLDELMQCERIEVLKKTKTREELSDIKPYIYELKEFSCTITENGVDDRKRGIYMLLASGSRMNIKPDSVLGALTGLAGVEYDPYDYRVHRLETYMGERDCLEPLLRAGDTF
ncbi:MAG: TIGR03936 family radical SAM-associated protein [Bacteroides sp.]|nr:TIGR03936 family radical SAM-associated protein [Bacteroides sp.]